MIKKPSTENLSEYGLGYFARLKEDKKLILDLLNSYRSKLSDATRTKLAKRINPEEVLKLEAKIQILKEIQNKLYEKI